MINGSPLSTLFEAIWTAMTMVYPLGSIYIMLNQDIEETILLEQSWVIGVASILYLGIALLNRDIILGSAAE